MVMRAALAALFLATAGPGAAEPTLKGLLETIDLAGVAISPDGKVAVFRTDQASALTNRHELAWWVVRLDQSAPARRVADAGAPLWTDAGQVADERPIWSSDSRSIYYRALIDGQVQVWRVDAAGAAAQPVTRDQSDVLRFALAGEQLIYSVGPSRRQIIDAEDREYDQGVRIDATVDPAQALTHAVEINGRLATQRLAGSWFDRRGLLGEAPERFFDLSLSSKALSPASPETAAAAGLTARAPPPPAVGRPAIRATSTLFGEARINSAARGGGLEVQRPDGRIVRCARPACEHATLAAVTWRPDRDEVVFTTSDAFRHSGLYIWSPSRDIVIPLSNGDGLDNAGGAYPSSCAVGPAALVCVHAGPKSQPRLDLVPLDGGPRSTLHDPAAPAMTDGYNTRPLSWVDASGRRFTGQLLTPWTRGRAAELPLFISYYVCAGYIRGGEGDGWPMPVMAAQGIAAVCINKPSGPLGDMVDQYDIALSGVTAIVHQLAAEGVIDSHKVGMGGLSFGSDTTLWVARNSTLLAAASIASVQIEPSYYWLNGVAGRDHHSVLRQVWGLGAPDETPDQWRRVSPALGADKLTVPLLMQMPEQELRPTMELFSRLSNSSTPVELYGFPNEPHILIQPRHRLASYARNLDWFKFWLLGDVDPAPEKAEQYRRWRFMAQRQADAKAQGSQDRAQVSTSAISSKRR